MSSVSRFDYGALNELAIGIIEGGAIRATKYISPKETMKATRRVYKTAAGNRGPIEILFTIGKPNYKEREFIKKCKKAKEPFPVRKTQLLFAKTTSKRG